MKMSVCPEGVVDRCQSVGGAHISSWFGVPLQRLQERFHGNLSLNLYTHTQLCSLSPVKLVKCVCLCTLQFFQKRGVSEAMSMYELFNAVSGLNIPVCDEVEAEFVAKVILSES